MRKTQLLFACGSLSRHVNGQVVMQRGTCCKRGTYRGPCESTEASFTLVLLKTEPGAKIKVKDSLRCASPGRKGEEEKGTEARKKVM